MSLFARNIPPPVRRDTELDPTRIGSAAYSLETRLNQKVMGQDAAKASIASLYQTYLAGMSPPGRPLGNFLYLGPTGSGKTHLVEMAAEILLKKPNAVTRIDCAEFQHGHEISKLAGSPPGYLGHRTTHPVLSQGAIDRHQIESAKFNFILFDEIEKASDALWNLLLGILDKATLTLGDSRKVDFSRTFIFMTSNLGAGEMDELLCPKFSLLPFGSDNEVINFSDQANKLTRIGVASARKRFSIEFINRLDKIITFQPLDCRQLGDVLNVELDVIQQRILNADHSHRFVFTVTESAKRHILDAGTSSQYGARYLKRAMERLIVQPLANIIATGQVRDGDWVIIDFPEAGGGLQFSKEAEKLAIHEMNRIVNPGVTVPSTIRMAPVSIASPSRRYAPNPQ